MARSWQWVYWIFGYFLSLLALIWVLCYFRQHVLAGYQVDPMSTGAVPVDSVSVGTADRHFLGTAPMARWTRDKEVACAGRVEIRTASASTTRLGVVWIRIYTRHDCSNRFMDHYLRDGGVRIAECPDNPNAFVRGRNAFVPPRHGSRVGRL